METIDSNLPSAMGEGVVAPARSRGMLRLTERSLQHNLNNQYPLDREKRDAMVEEAYRLAMRSDSERVRVAALRVLALLDQVNVRREANAIAETGQELSAATDRLRTTLGSQAARDAMAALSAAVTGNVEKPCNPPLLADSKAIVDVAQPPLDQVQQHGNHDSSSQHNGPQ